MEKLINWLISTWSDAGWGGQIFILLFTILILFTLLRSTLNNFVIVISGILSHLSEMIFGKKFLKQSRKNKKDNKNSHHIDSDIMGDDKKINKYELTERIKNHRLMIEINEIKFNINNSDFGDKDRNDIFRSIISIHINSVKKNIDKLVDTYDIDELDENKFVRVITGMISDIVNDVNSGIKDKFGKEIFDLVMMEPGRGVRTWSKNIDKNTWRLIDEFCTVNYIKYNHQRLLFILTAISTSLNIVFNGMEARFKDFNGELTELINKRKREIN